MKMSGDGDKVALVAEGELRNETEVMLGTGAKHHREKAFMSRGYPEGQNLRGAMGYLFLDAQAALIQSYKDSNPAAIYFRDARPRHRDGGELLPVNVKGRFVNYRCSKCGSIERFPSRMSPIKAVKLDRRKNSVNAMYSQFGIVGPHMFDFRAALALKGGNGEHAHEFIGALERFAEEGIRLGRKKRKGKGRFSLGELNYSTVTLDDIRGRAEELSSMDELNMHFLSDVVVEDEGSLTQGLILRSIKNTAKFLHPGYEPYPGPTVKISVESLKTQKGVFLDKKVGQRQRVDNPNIVPRGAIARMKVFEAHQMFWEALALAECCTGIGSRTSSGKGEFTVPL